MTHIKYLVNLNLGGIKLGLQKTRKLLAACNNPEKKIRSIQIVGTNGKGSIAGMICNAFVSQNYKVGLFTSPHLVKINERIQINFRQIEDHQMKKFINRYKKSIDEIEASFFEVLTVMALWHFSKKKVDFAILETGLGGRLDSVTACKSEGVIFASISKDHEHILGNNLKQITREKAGAITAKTKYLLSGNQKHQIKEGLKQVAKKHNKQVKFINGNIFKYKKDSFLYLKGQHQIYNGNIAYYSSIETAKHFNLEVYGEKIKKNILNTFWPGRMQTIQNKPKIIFDVCHNADGVQACFDYMMDILTQYKTKYLIVAFENKKQIKKSLYHLVELFDYVTITETKIRNSMDAINLTRELNLDHVAANQSIINALSTNVRRLLSNDILLIIGSHFIGPSISKKFKNCFANNKKV